MTLKGEKVEREKRFKAIPFAFKVVIPKKLLIRILEKLPEDAELMYCQFDYTQKVSRIILYSKEFEVVPDGEHFKDMMITVRKNGEDWDIDIKDWEGSSFPGLHENIKKVKEGE
jgi:hypothetical protein